MKSFFTITLLVVMLAQTFSKVLIMVDYQANKEYIMAFLCINRDQPELQCEGKCYLQNKLQKQDQSEKQQDKQTQEVSIQLFCQDLFCLDTTTAILKLHHTAFYAEGPARRLSLFVFHPPQFLV